MYCNGMEIENLLKTKIEDCREILKNLFDNQSEQFAEFANVVLKAIKDNRTIFWCGNGGSAAESSHLATELIGRFKLNRKPLKSLSLNADSAVLTCIANDFGYEEVYSRQLEALGEVGDVLIVLSTSGQSKNILQVLKSAKKLGLYSISLLGGTKNQAAEISNLVISINSSETARIQEIHLLLGHILCEYIDNQVTKC